MPGTTSTAQQGSEMHSLALESMAIVKNERISSVLIDQSIATNMLTK